MKRIYIFFLVFFCIFSLFLHKNDVFFDYFKKFDNSEFCYVTDTIPTKDTSVRAIKSGNLYFNYFKRQCNAQSNVEYKHVHLNGDKDLIITICKDLNIVAKEKEMYEEKEILFGYSPLFSKYILHNEKKINIQMVFSDNTILIGYPCVYIAF